MKLAHNPASIRSNPLLDNGREPVCQLSCLGLMLLPRLTVRSILSLDIE